MKKVRKFLATALAVVMSMSMAAPAFAAEATPDTAEQQTEVVVEAAESVGNDNGGLMQLDMSSTWVGHRKTTVAYKAGGINATIWLKVKDWDGAKYQVNITMSGNNGTIWEADNCTGIFDSKDFWCGPDVTRVEVEIAPRMGWITPDKSFLVECTY